MAFTSATPLASQTATSNGLGNYNAALSAPYGQHQFGLYPSYYANNPLLNDYSNRSMSQNDNTSNFKYNYTPTAWTPPQGLASLANLYGDASSPWYVGNAGTPNAQSNAQTSPNLGGWDSAAFMQGLQSLGYNI